MAFSSQPIYNVRQHYYAYSPSGELASRHASECVVIAVIFGDNSIMMGHYTDVELIHDDDENAIDYDDQVMELFDDIAKHIIQLEKQASVIKSVYMIGGCDSQQKNMFQTSLHSIKNEDLKDTKEALSDLTNGLIIYHLIEATKMIDVAWNVAEAAEFGLNEPFIDIVVLHHQQSGHYLLVRQCINIVKNGNKDSVCCGALSFKLNTTSHNNNQSCVSGSEFYINKSLTESYTDEEDVKIINTSIQRFIQKATHLAGEQMTTSNELFTSILEENMLNRLTNNVPAGVKVKRL